MRCDFVQFSNPSSNTSNQQIDLFQVDVANYEEIVALKERIKTDLGDVDILINNAGLLPRVSLLQGNPEDILRIVKVNLVSYIWVSAILFCFKSLFQEDCQKNAILIDTDDPSIFAGHDIEKQGSYCCNQLNFRTSSNWPCNYLFFYEIWYLRSYGRYLRFDTNG